MPSDTLTTASRAVARAQFELWNTILVERDARVLAIESDATSMYRRMAVNAAALEIALELHVSEQQVWRILIQAERLRDQLPAVWSAFSSGIVSEQKASVLAVAVDRLDLDVSREALDEHAVAYASTHTPAELRRWADQIVDRLEPTSLPEAEEARARRSVDVEHRRNGMSDLFGHIPTVAAVAIKRRLRKAARALPDDGRTLEQKMADLYMAWLTSTEGSVCDIQAEIAVVVEAEALAGVTDAPAVVDPESPDPAPMPAAWVLALADLGDTLWTQLLTDRAGRVFDVTYLGYQPPDKLRRAKRWQESRCSVNGCSRPAEESDLDHEIPYDSGGETSGRNLNHKCRRHHGMKGHDLLPAHAFRRPESIITRLPAPAFRIDYIPAA